MLPHSLTRRLKVICTRVPDKHRRIILPTDPGMPEVAEEFTAHGYSDGSYELLPIQEEKEEKSLYPDEIIPPHRMKYRQAKRIDLPSDGRITIPLPFRTHPATEASGKIDVVVYGSRESAVVIIRSVRAPTGADLPKNGTH